jgi:uncharacterized protein (DUF1697 family)
MARYAAFLRGVMPTNVTMPALRACFEAAGLEEVKTLLSSGNLVFATRATPARSLERRIEATMRDQLGQVFMTIVRGEGALQAILASDPYKPFRLHADAKRIVTFLRKAPPSRLKLPIESDGARILCMRGAEVFSAYVPNPRGPVFMNLIERTLGKDVTTRTWDTVRRVGAAVKSRP